MSRRRPGLIVTHYKLPAVLTVTGLVCVLSVSCSASKRVEQAELARARVTDAFRLVDEGVQEGFNDFVFRLYIGPPDVAESSIVDPPSRSYQPFALIRNFRRGWRPIAGWRGPSADGTRECLLALESAADPAEVAGDLTAGERAQLVGGRRVLVRVSVACSTRQHSFD